MIFAAALGTSILPDSPAPAGDRQDGGLRDARPRRGDEAARLRRRRRDGRARSAGRRSAQRAPRPSDRSTSAPAWSAGAHRLPASSRRPAP